MSEPSILPPSSPLGYESAGTVAESDPAQRTQAMLAHVLGIFGILGTGIFYLIKKNDPTAGPFLKDQMKEALNFEIFVAVAYVALVILSILIGFVVPKLLILVGLAYFALIIGNIVLVVISGMKANRGIAARYPVRLGLVK